MTTCHWQHVLVVPFLVAVGGEGVQEGLETDEVAATKLVVRDVTTKLIAVIS